MRVLTRRGVEDCPFIDFTGRGGGHDEASTSRRSSLAFTHPHLDIEPFISGKNSGANFPSGIADPIERQVPFSPRHRLSDAGERFYELFSFT